MRFDTLSVPLAVFYGFVAIQARVHNGNLSDVIHSRGGLPVRPLGDRPGISPKFPLVHGSDAPLPELVVSPGGRPRPHGGDEPPVPTLPDDPDEELPDTDSIFETGGYESNGGEALFDSPWFTLFDKQIEKLTSSQTTTPAKSAVTPSIYEQATGAQQPFKQGQSTPIGKVITIIKTIRSDSGQGNPTANPAPTGTEASGSGSQQVITTTFDPASPTDVCGAWASLANYCRSAGTSCACYSGAFYVPDQWNSLASYCGSAAPECDSFGSSSAYWCSVASQAFEYQSYCPTDLSPTYRFAAQTGSPCSAQTTEVALLSTPHCYYYSASLPAQTPVHSSQPAVTSRQAPVPSGQAPVPSRQTTVHTSQSAVPSSRTPAASSQTPVSSGQTIHGYSPWMISITLALSYGMFFV